MARERGADTPDNQLLHCQNRVVAIASAMVIWGGLVTVTASVWWACLERQWASAGVLTLTYLAVAAVLWRRGSSTQFRANVLVLVGFASGAAQMALDATHGAGYQVTLASIVLASLITSRRTAIRWAATMVATVLTITGLYAFHVIPSVDPDVGGVLWWLSWGGNFALIAVALTAVVQYIVHQLVISLEESGRRGAELARANAAKDEILSVISHELRTPLTPAMLTLDVLRHDERLQVDVRAMVSDVFRQVEHEAELVNDLLYLTEVATRQVKLRTVPRDVHGIVRLAVAGSRSLQDSAIPVSMELSATRAIVNVDQDRLQQVIRHLLSNAAKFRGSNGSLQIRTENREHDGKPWLRIHFADTGIGMDAKQLDQSFGAFEQADRTRTRRFGGLGIGLTLARAIAEAHGGRVLAHSDGPGKGCTITVELPVYGDERGTSVTPPAREQPPVARFPRA